MFSETAIDVHTNQFEISFTASTGRNASYIYTANFTSRIPRDNARIFGFCAFLSKLPDVTILGQVSPELLVLASEISVSIRDEKPRYQRACHGERGSDEKHSLQSLALCCEGVLNGSEHLSTNSGTGLANRRSKAQEVAANRGWEGFCSAEESGDLFQKTREPNRLPPLRKPSLHMKKSDLLTPGPISPSPLKMPYKMMKSGRMFMSGKTAPPMTKPMRDHSTKPRAIVCLRPILSMSRPPSRQPGR